MEEVSTIATQISDIAAGVKKDIDVFKGILSSYVMRGQTKGAVWAEGVKNGVFLELMRRMTALFFATNID